MLANPLCCPGLEPIREVLESDESDAIHCCALDSLAERAMWEPEHRLAGLRYPSDLTDAEWAIVAPTIPPGRNGGRRRSVNVRDVLTGSSTCCGPAGQWKGAAQESAAEQHGARPSRALELGRTLSGIHHALYVTVQP